MRRWVSPESRARSPRTRRRSVGPAAASDGKREEHAERWTHPRRCEVGPVRGDEDATRCKACRGACTEVDTDERPGRAE